MKLRGRLEAVQQALTAIVLIATAAERGSSPTSTEMIFIGVLSLTGVLLLVVAIREFRGAGAGGSRLLNAAAGLALMAEWADSRVHGAKFLQPGLVMGVLSLGLALFHARIESWREGRRTMRIDDVGISWRLNALRKFSVGWAEIEWVSVERGQLRIHLRAGGDRSISVPQDKNMATVTELVLERCRRQGVQVRTADGSGLVSRTMV